MEDIDIMKDYIVRATAANGQVRAFAATTKDVVETARKDHNMSPFSSIICFDMAYTRESLILI